MRKIFSLFILMAVFVVAACAAEIDTVAAKQWKIKSEASLGMTQSAYSDNWQGGQAGPLVWISNFHALAERLYTERWYWKNSFSFNSAKPIIRISTPRNGPSRKNLRQDSLRRNPALFQRLGR